MAVDGDAVIWARAREAHPALPGDDEACKAFLAAVTRAAGARHAGDLYLAWACERGDAAALAVFERDVVPALSRALATFADRGELVQVLRERMLVRGGIAAYDGRAPLVTWLRVCATRIGLREQERARRAEPLDDRRLEELAPGVPDPELAYLQRLYGASFREAFDGAVKSLAPRERNLLRLAVIDGLGIDQLAAIFHVHRATVARRLAHARQTLVAPTRARMRVALAVSESELESVMRVIRSLTDVTLRQALGRRNSE